MTNTNYHMSKSTVLFPIFLYFIDLVESFLEIKIVCQSHMHDPEKKLRLCFDPVATKNVCLQYWTRR